MRYVLNLAEVSYKDVTTVGGKAASLGEMLQAGIAVPPGFVITTRAYQEGMTSKLKAEIYTAFETLGLERVAVRSSAVAEDSETVSWAGQLESYLNTHKETVIADIERCWSSINSDQAKDYADKNSIDEEQRQVAVIVQAMVDSELSGVMFTANPISQSVDEYLIEAVYGLCEPLVQGEVIPETLRVDKVTKEVIERTTSQQRHMLSYNDGRNKKVSLPPSRVGKQLLDDTFITQLAHLADVIEAQYKHRPQDIEWAIHKGMLYAIQSRPITTLSSTKADHEQSRDVMLPSWNSVDLFYWGPSRAKPMYMSDYMAAVEQFYLEVSKDPAMPDPPETLVLFSENKMVWLNKTEDFTGFVKTIFGLYERRDKLEEDIQNWRNVVQDIDNEGGDTERLVEAWGYTQFAEFSLYGARDVITERLLRFDPKTRQIIWGAFTLPEKSTFMSRIDEELITSNDPASIAARYPWIEDGYSGTANNALEYVTRRLKLLHENPIEMVTTRRDRQQLINELGLTAEEIRALDLARQLAELLDERKAWMMRTRRYITHSMSKIEFGWLFKDGAPYLIDERDTNRLWNRYINFKASSSTLQGMVACSGGMHFITGTVTVLTSPTDSVKNDQILVVPSTSPSYVPLMRTARALITDHGGMISHAAIVSRELKVPCVVATKHATKVLKTGDKVVIDLVRGVISK